MNIRRRVAYYAGINTGEGSIFGILFLQCFTTGFATAFFFVTVSAHFIQKASLARLPLAYVLSGTAGMVLMGVYKRKIARSGIVPAYLTGLIAYAVLCLLLYASLLCWGNNSTVAIPLAYLGFVMVMPFSTMFSLGFSSLCLRVFDLSQSKRLLALVNTGDTVAAILAYLFVPFFVQRIYPDPVHLLPVAAFFVVLSVIPLNRLWRRHALQFRFVPSNTADVKLNGAFFVKDKFYLIIAIATLFSVLAVYLADYTYLISVRCLALQTEWKLTTIISSLFCMIKIGELVFSFLSKNIITSKGMKFSLMLLPLSLVFSSLMGFVSDRVFSGSSLFLLVFLLLSKWSERVIRKGVTAPVMRVLYQVAPPHERVKIQTSIEGSLSQAATVFSGLLLLLLTALYPGADTLLFLNRMTVVGLVVYSCWLFVNMKLFKSYRVKIQRYLRGIRTGMPQNTALQNKLPAGEDVLKQSAGIHDEQQRAPDWQVIIKNELSCLNGKDDRGFLTLVASYNPAIAWGSYEKDQESLFKNLLKAYSCNSSFFSRLLIIWYMSRMPAACCMRFMKEAYDESDIILKREIVSLLHAVRYRASAEEVFYFTELCHACTAEIVWVLASIHDMEELKNKRLDHHLSLVAAALKNLLLELIKVLHEPAMILEAEPVLMQHDSAAEDHLFAIELLDSILRDDLKDFVIPVFEDIPFSAKAKRLNKVLPVYSLPVEQRLKEILMKDFRVVDPCTKQTALEIYFARTGNREILHAFAASELENMALLCTGLLNKDTGVAQNKMALIKNMNLFLSDQPVYQHYLASNGVRIEKRKQLQPGTALSSYDTSRHTVYLLTNEGRIGIDVLGLTMLFRLHTLPGFRPDGFQGYMLAG